jgi:surface antigen
MGYYDCEFFTCIEVFVEMANIIIKNIAVLCMGGMLAACNNSGEVSKQTLVGVVGAVGGGVIGSKVGKGLGNTAAIIGGTLIGGLLGSEIGKSLDKADITYHGATQVQALENNRSGISSSWNNPDSGAHGSFTPTKTYRSSNGYCREFTQTVSVGGQTQKAYGTACRQPDGSWQMQN